MTTLPKIKVFFSYAHEDEDIKKRIDLHLATLKRSNQIETWNDRQLIPGQSFDDTIKDKLEDAHLVLLLISPAFIASEYIWNIELKNALSRHELGKAVVIPIFCKPCDFKNMPFSKFQGLPKDARPITNYANMDDALLEVALGIRATVEHITGLIAL